MSRFDQVETHLLELYATTERSVEVPTKFAKLPKSFIWDHLLTPTAEKFRVKCLGFENEREGKARGYFEKGKGTKSHGEKGGRGNFDGGGGGGVSLVHVGWLVGVASRVDNALAHIERTVKESTIKTLSRRQPTVSLVNELRKMCKDVVSSQGSSRTGGEDEDDEDEDGAAATATTSPLSVQVGVEGDPSERVVRVTLACISRTSKPALHAALESFRTVMDSFSSVEFDLADYFTGNTAVSSAAQVFDSLLGNAALARAFASNFGLSGAEWDRSRKVVTVNGERGACDAAIASLLEAGEGLLVESVGHSSLHCIDMPFIFTLP
jgi:hypothetical protein